MGEARKRPRCCPDQGKEIYGRVRDKAVEGAKVADKTVRANPYQAIAIGVVSGRSSVICWAAAVPAIDSVMEESPSASNNWPRPRNSSRAGC